MCWTFWSSYIIISKALGHMENLFIVLFGCKKGKGRSEIELERENKSRINIQEYNEVTENT